jgi:hypothetical protein
VDARQVQIAAQTDALKRWLEAKHPDIHPSIATVKAFEENARRKSLSVSELHKLSRQENPPPQPDALPQFYTPIGKKKPIELTAEVLRNSGNRNAELSTADLKFLIRRFGSSEVNKRLGVQSRPQPGYTTRVQI